MNKFVTACLAVTLLLVSTHVPALGLGNITVESGINQKFRARIALVSASAEDIESIRARLADQEAFESAGLERSMVLTGLRFRAVGAGEASYIEISSKDSVREPALEFIIEVVWARGRLLREYQVLLDRR